MHKTTLASIVLVLASSAYAQTTFPVGYDTTDGGWYSYYLGSFQDGHFQNVCGGLQGSNKVQSWKSLALRRSNNRTNANTGRSWTNVTLTLSDCDYTKLSDTYTRNQINPKQVFSAKVTWPDVPAGAPPNKPATWGFFAAKDDLLFPFTSSYVHTGKWGTTFDWVFRGGTLKNAVAWNTATTIFLRAYYTDGIANNNQSASVNAVLTPTVTGCTTGYFVNWLMSDYKVGGGAQHRSQPYTMGGLPNAKHIGVIGIENGSFIGVPTGGSCHDLYIDFKKPFIVFPYTTNAAGDYFSDFLTAPFIKSAVGLSVWSQAAYSDKGSFQLTRAGKAPIAALPTGKPIVFAQHIYHFDLKRPLGFGPAEVRVPILYLK
ncbi:MAG: hypothetical protein ACYTGW_10365 [Planctomycetota bacterium]|jgi:hypothetical protein